MSPRALPTLALVALVLCAGVAATTRAPEWPASDAEMVALFNEQVSAWEEWVERPDELKALFNDGRAAMTLHFAESPAAQGTFDSVMGPFLRMLSGLSLTAHVEAVVGPRVVFSFTDAFRFTSGCLALVSGIAVSEYDESGRVVAHEMFAEHAASWSECMETLELPPLQPPRLTSYAARRLVEAQPRAWAAAMRGDVSDFLALFADPTTPFEVHARAATTASAVAPLFTAFDAAIDAAEWAFTYRHTFGHRRACFTFVVHARFAHGCEALARGVAVQQFDEANKIVLHRAFFHNSDAWDRCNREAAELAAAEKKEEL